MYSLEQEDQVRGELSYISCLDMMNGCLPSSSQSFPWPSWWIPKLCSNTTNKTNYDIIISQRTVSQEHMVFKSAHDEAWSALLDQQKKPIVPLYKRLENFKRIQQRCIPFLLYRQAIHLLYNLNWIQSLWLICACFTLISFSTTQWATFISYPNSILPRFVHNVYSKLVIRLCVNYGFGLSSGVKENNFTDLPVFFYSFINLNRMPPGSFKCYLKLSLQHLH